MYLSASLSHPTQTRLQRKAAVRREFEFQLQSQGGATRSDLVPARLLLAIPSFLAAGGISECVWGKLPGLKPFMEVA